MSGHLTVCSNAQIARGEEPLLQGVTAGDMRELAWDEELARGAQLWADQCTWSHDSNDVCRSARYTVLTRAN